MKNHLDDFWKRPDQQQQLTRILPELDSLGVSQSLKFLSLHNTSQNLIEQQMLRFMDASVVPSASFNSPILSSSVLDAIKSLEIDTSHLAVNLIKDLDAHTQSLGIAVQAHHLAELAAVPSIPLNSSLLSTPFLNAIPFVNREFSTITTDFYKSLGARAELLSNVVVSDSLKNLCERIDLASRINFELPLLAMSAWPTEIISKRFSLLEDSFRNIAVLEHLQTDLIVQSIKQPVLIERVELATDIVSSHSNFIRRLPPIMTPAAEPENDHSEEIGFKLEVKLEEIDPRLAELRRTSWKNFGSGKSGARLAAHGIREIYNEILRRFAPDEILKQTEIWKERKDQTLSNPTRRMRFEYIVGSAAADLAGLLQFDESIRHGNKFAHIFADEIEVVRAYLGQLESCIYLTIVYAVEPKKSK